MGQRKKSNRRKAIKKGLNPACCEVEPKIALLRIEQLGSWNEGEVWNWRSVSARLCLRISTTDSGKMKEIWRQQRPEVQTFPKLQTITA